MTESPNTMRIDDFARDVGLSVRNIRSYHERGLLQPPEVRARTGYYGPDHRERVRLIQNLQDEGLKLDGVKRVLEASSSDGLIRVKQAADATDQHESPEFVPRQELLDRLSVAPEDGPDVVATAQKLGILMPVGEDQLQVLSPSLIDAAEEIIRGGMSLDRALELVGQVGRHSEAIAKGFVDGFVDEVWKPFAEAGMPEEDWPRIAEAMERTRPVAALVALTVFRQKMNDEVEARFASIAKRIGEGKR
jgi:DNA-binding transcriptional MerR regulator